MRLALAACIAFISCTAVAQVKIQSPVQLKPEQQAILKEASAKLKACSIRSLGKQQHAALQMQLALAYVIQGPKILTLCKIGDYEGVRSTMIATNTKPEVQTFLQTQEDCYFEVKRGLKDEALVSKLQGQMSKLGITGNPGEFRTLETLDVPQLCTMLQGA